MNETNFYLVFNLGLKSLRAIVFTQDGDVVFSQYIPIHTVLNGNMVEQNPLEWWNKVDALFLAIAERPQIAHNIQGITVTSSAACLVPTDHEGTPLHNALMVSDKRTESEASDIESRESFRQVKNDVGMGISAYYMLPKILWMKRKRFDIYNRSRFFLSPNDYLIYKLTNRFVTDVFNAQKYHFNTRTHEYPLALLGELELDQRMLPEVQEPSYVIGEIRSELAKRYCLSQKPKIVLATYDAICAFFGSSSDQDRIACDVSGTVTSVRTGTDRSLNHNIENIFCSFLKGQNLNVVGASNNLGGGLIEWAKQAFYEHLEDPYDLMAEEAQKSQLGARGLIFLPYLMGERAPIWDNNVRGMFFGIERIHTRRDFIRSVFESTAFVTNDLIQEIEINGIKIDTIRLSGGLSRIDLISQIKADVTGKRIEILNEAETTSVGALAFLLTGLNVFPDLKSATCRFTKVSTVYEPNLRHHDKYKNLFVIYKQLYRANKDLFKARKEVVDSIYEDKISSLQNL